LRHGLEGGGLRPAALPLRLREPCHSTCARHLSEPFTAVLEDYAAALKSAPLSDQTRRTYASKVRQFLAWLADAESDGDALNATDARDWAVRDYRSHLQTALKRKPATVNNALAAVDDLYIRRGLGPANAARADLTTSAPRALSTRAAVRFLRAVDGRPSPRDRAIALVPFYAGTRIAEIVGLDTDDVRLSARKGILRIRGKGEKVREIPIHPQLRATLTGWLDERPDWPGADSPPCFSTSAAPGCPSRARTTSSPPSPPRQGSTTTSPPTSCATRSRRGSCAAAPTSSSSPSCSATPASRPRACTPGPPTKTRSTRSSYSTSTTDTAPGPARLRRRLRCGSTFQGPRHEYRPAHRRAAALLALSALSWLYRTWDQGPEMRDWKHVSVAADIDIYFCDPHAPWQRATNENTNGLLRQYFPKGSDLPLHSALDLDWVATELNDRPRKRLGFSKPIEEIGPLLLQ